MEDEGGPVFQQQQQLSAAEAAREARLAPFKKMAKAMSRNPRACAHEYQFGKEGKKYGRGLSGGALTRAERKEYEEIQAALANLREVKKSLQPIGTKLRDLSPDKREQFRNVDAMFKKLSARYSELFAQEQRAPDETDSLPNLPRSVEETREAPRDLGPPHSKFVFKGG